eukprot:1157517-Pelagomonas_calceolata.AAC.13
MQVHQLAPDRPGQWQQPIGQGQPAEWASAVLQQPQQQTESDALFALSCVPHFSRGQLKHA